MAGLAASLRKVCSRPMVWLAAGLPSKEACYRPKYCHATVSRPVAMHVRGSAVAGWALSIVFPCSRCLPLLPPIFLLVRCSGCACVCVRVRISWCVSVMLAMACWWPMAVLAASLRKVCSRPTVWLAAGLPTKEARCRPECCRAAASRPVATCVEAQLLVGLRRLFAAGCNVK